RREIQVQAGEQFEPCAEPLAKQGLDRSDMADHEERAGAEVLGDAATSTRDAGVDRAERFATRRGQLRVGEPAGRDLAVAGEGLAEGEALPRAEVRLPQVIVDANVQ